jgi:hypothetical protein
MHQDPDPSFHFDQDPDPTTCNDADPNPSPHQSDFESATMPPLGLHACICERPRHSMAQCELLQRLCFDFDADPDADTD